MKEFIFYFRTNKTLSLNSFVILKSLKEYLKSYNNHFINIAKPNFLKTKPLSLLVLS